MPRLKNPSAERRAPDGSGMARGWESKSVESQVESAETRKATSGARPLTPEQISQRKERQDLELSRTRILRELDVATNPRHRAQLEAALKFLDDKIAKLQ